MDSEFGYDVEAAMALLDVEPDFYGGWRLPEYRRTWSDLQGQEHPLLIVGRRMHCLVHDDKQVRDLANWSADPDRQTPCRQLATDWAKSYTQLQLVDESAADEFQPEFSLTIRVMIARMADSVGSSLSWAENAYMMVPELGGDPDYLVDASELGVTYLEWGYLKRHGWEGLVRPGMIERDGKLDYYIKGWLDSILESGRPELVAAFEAGQEDFNFWGCLHSYVGGTLDIAQKRKAILQALPELRQVKQLVTKAVVHDRDEGVVYYMYQNRAEQDRWLPQGILTEERVNLCRELVAAHPDLGDGRVAWLAQNADILVGTSLRPLAPIRPTKEELNLEITYNSKREAKLVRGVVQYLHQQAKRARIDSEVTGVSL